MLLTPPYIRPEDEGCGPDDFPSWPEWAAEAMVDWIRGGCVPRDYPEHVLDAVDGDDSG